MQPYLKLPKDLFQDIKVQELLRIEKEKGSSMFINLFLKCGNESKSAYVIPYSKDLIQGYKVLHNIKRQKNKLITDVLSTMLRLNILDISLFKLGLIYMPMVVKLDKKYFLAQMKDNDFQNTVMNNLMFLYKKYVYKPPEPLPPEPPEPSRYIEWCKQTDLKRKSEFTPDEQKQIEIYNKWREQKILQERAYEKQPTYEAFIKTIPIMTEYYKKVIT